MHTAPFGVDETEFDIDESNAQGSGILRLSLTDDVHMHSNDAAVEM
jgi:hypothetical protein